jgi:hypothetical protein
MWKKFLVMSISMVVVGCGSVEDAISNQKTTAASDKPAECSGNGRTDIPTQPALADNWKILSNTWPTSVWADMRDKCIQSFVDFEIKCAVSFPEVIKTDSCGCWAMGMTSYTVYPENTTVAVSEAWAYWCGYSAAKKFRGAK